MSTVRFAGGAVVGAAGIIASNIEGSAENRSAVNGHIIGHLHSGDLIVENSIILEEVAVGIVLQVGDRVNGQIQSILNAVLHQHVLTGQDEHNIGHPTGPTIVGYGNHFLRINRISTVSHTRLDGGSVLNASISGPVLVSV